MTGQITIPFWLFLILLTAMVWVVLELLLVPSVRWFLRRRLNRVLEEIGTRLDIEIRPFQLTKRQVLIDRLVYDPKVVEVIQKTAKERELPPAMVQEEVLSYAREIVPSFNAYLYFRTGYWLAKKVARLMYWVRVGLVDNEQLAGVDPESTVVFVMNHRSNMDYILVAFLAAERTTLSYAVGEWARIWPLQTLIKAMGAYFVRRDSGDPLYRLVLERYVHMATKEGVCQAVFLEGGLSRDGRLRRPKHGLMDYMLRGFDPDVDRDIVFIPVGINYDRTIEDRSLIRALDPQAEKRSFWFVIRTTTGFVCRNVMLMVLNRWQRFGFACVNFGAPTSLRTFCRENNLHFSRMDREARFPVVERICDQIMHAVEELVPVLPISLVATVMLEDTERWLSEFDIKAHAHRLLERLQGLGAPVLVPTRGLEVAVSTAFHMLKIRKMLEESEGYFRAERGSHDILKYYANAILYWQERSQEQEGEDAYGKGNFSEGLHTPHPHPL